MTCRLASCLHASEPEPCPVHPPFTIQGSGPGNMMTPEQELHLSGIIQEFTSRCDAKYRVGQKEHGGNLFDLTPLQLATEALQEAIDQVVYLKTLRDQIIDATRAANG